MSEYVEIAWSYPAGEDGAKKVLDATPNDGPAAAYEDDGRSGWRWIRLANGDLILGVFPHGDTYFAVEDEVERDYSQAQDGGTLQTTTVDEPDLNNQGLAVVRVFTPSKTQPGRSKVNASRETSLTIRYTDDAWENFYGVLADMAEKGFGVEITTKDGAKYDGVLDAIEGGIWQDQADPKLTIRKTPSGVVTQVPLYTPDPGLGPGPARECNIVDVMVL